MRALTLGLAALAVLERGFRSAVVDGISPAMRSHQAALRLQHVEVLADGDRRDREPGR